MNFGSLYTSLYADCSDARGRASLGGGATEAVPAWDSYLDGCAVSIDRVPFPQIYPVLLASHLYLLARGSLPYRG